MFNRTTKAALAAMVALIVSGCGGSSGHHPINTATNLRFTGGAGFNGSTSAIATGAATVTTNGGHIISTVIQGSRTLMVDISPNTLEPGDTFAADGTSATVTYSQTANGQTSTWVSTSGQIVVVNSVSNNGTGTLQLNNVVMQPGTNAGNTAAGTFTLNGTVGGVTIFPVTSGGNAFLNFSQGADSNAEKNNISTETNVTFSNGGAGVGTITVTSNQTASLRVFTITLPANATSGTSVGVAVDAGGMTFVQGTGDNTKTWVATSGTITVLQRTSTGVRVHLSNVVFAPASGSNTAVGTFVIDGVVTFF